MKYSELTESIDYIINILNTKISKTDLLAIILSNIMKICNIKTQEYFVMASYGLRGIREVGDLDVAVTKRAFKILENANIPKSIAKISGTKRLFIKLPKIDAEAEIEFFELENKGFPTNDFSINNLSKNNSLIQDPFGNQYLNAKALANFYSEVKLVDNKFMIGNFEVSRERILKSLSHLKLLYDNSKKNKSYINTKINKLNKLLL